MSGKRRCFPQPTGFQVWWGDAQDTREKRGPLQGDRLEKQKPTP
jgi:hypothetical protein